MIDLMPKTPPPYVIREVNRHGNPVWYFRIGKGKRTRLPDLGSPDFNAAYQQAWKATELPAPKRKAGVHTVEWLIGQYKQSSAFMAYSPATRRQRENIFRHVIADAGLNTYAKVKRKHIIKGREKRSETPAQARNFLDAMRGLFRWALDNDYVSDDPTAGVTNPKRPKGPGFEVWTDEEVAAYRAHWEMGTRQRLWLEVLIGTGARRGDAVIIGRQHMKDGMISIRTEKQDVWAFVPVLHDMLEAIKHCPTGSLTFIVGARGENLKKESFGNMFRAACNAAGVRKSAHGLRKYATTAYAEAGLSDSELETIFGWVPGSSMAAHYRKTAERKRIAEGAAGKLVNKLSPHPSPVDRTAKKG